MKQKLTLLLLALVTSMGAWAQASITVDTSSPLTDVSQISTDKYYVLKNVGHGAYMNVNPNTGQVQITATLPTTDTGLLPFIVRFESNTNAKSEGDAYQVKFYDGTYLPWQSNGGANYVSATKGWSSNNEGYLPVYETDHFYFQVYKGGTSRTVYFNGNTLTDGVGGFTFWTATGDNSNYQIYEATCDDFQEIFYAFSFQGNTTDQNSRKLLTVKNTTIARPTNTALDNKPSYVGNSWVGFSITAPSDGSAITIPITVPFVTKSIVGDEFAWNTPLYRLKGNVGNSPTYIKNSSSSIIYKPAEDPVTNDDYFCFTGDPFEGFKIYNIGAGATINVGSDTPAQGTAPAITSSEHIWRIFANGSKYGMQQMKTDDTSLSNAYFCNVGGVFTYWISGWAEADGGARMDIEPVTFDVTYNVLLEAGGSTVASGTETKTTGGDMTLNVNSTTAGRAFCTYTYYTDVACTDEITSTVFGGTTTVYALANVNLPFSADKYYYMKLRNHYVYYDETNDYVRTNQTTMEKTDAYRWSFSGDPYNGIKVKNKQTGTYLDNTDGNVQLSAGGYAWRISRLGETSTFGLNNGSNYINEKNHTDFKLIYWWKFADDQGSQFNIAEVEPQSGDFIRIKGARSGKYMTGNTYNKGGANRLGQSSEANASTIFYLDGNKLLSYTTGFYVTATCEPGTVGSTPSTYEFTPDGTAIDEFKIAGNSAYLYSWVDTYDCFDRNGSTYADQCHMKVEKVTSLPITMRPGTKDGAYYATINLPVAVTIPSGLSAYSATADGTVMTLTKVVEDGVLAANQPVILYSKSDFDELAIATTAGTTAGSNELEGTIAAESVTANQNYVLGEHADVVGFYKFGGTTMPGFKAYLPVGKTSNVKAFTFRFEDVEDAIRAIESENSGLEIYDIAGRRVQQAQKGLYIINGKKVLFK